MPQIRQAGTRTRDLLGYAGSPPNPHWPGGARVAVSIVVNFEEGSEFSISDGDPENEAVYEIEQRLVGQPDPGAGRKPFKTCRRRKDCGGPKQARRAHRADPGLGGRGTAQASTF